MCQGTGRSQEQQDHDLRHQVAGLHGQVPVLSLDEEDRRLQAAQDKQQEQLYQHQGHEGQKILLQSPRAGL